MIELVPRRASSRPRTPSPRSKGRSGALGRGQGSVAGRVSRLGSAPARGPLGGRVILLVSALAWAWACNMPSATLELPPERPSAPPPKKTEPKAAVADAGPITNARLPVPGGVGALGSRAEDIDGIMALCERFEDDCERHWFDSEAPQEFVEVAAFEIDRLEVTNAEYEGCVVAGACTARALGACKGYGEDLERGPGGGPVPVEGWDMATPERVRDFTGPSQPAVCVTPDEAEDYCRFAGGRLPDRAQWEVAAHGRTNRIWPWGNEEPTCAHATFASARGGMGCGAWATRSVGTTQGYPSPHGALDMAGNAAEWVRPHDEPPGASGEFEIRGGHWATEPVYLRCAERGHFATDFRGIYVGFRCAYPPDGAKSGR